MSKYRKVPVVIDALQLVNTTEDDVRDLFEWVKSFGNDPFEHFILNLVEGGVAVKTLEGTSYDVPAGYYIIRGVEGEYYPCAPHIFEKTYEKV